MINKGDVLLTKKYCWEVISISGRYINLARYHEIKGTMRGSMSRDLVEFGIKDGNIIHVNKKDIKN